MKVKRKELIDFADYMASHYGDYTIDSIQKEWIDEYLKSINSKARNEAPTVTDNEAKNEVCDHKTKRELFERYECVDCGKLFIDK